MIDIDIDRLKHLYYTEKKNTSQIAEIFGCSPPVISKRMKENGLQRRTLSEAKTLQYSQTKIQLDITELVRLYFKEHLSLAAVGERLGVSYCTVRRRLIAAGYTLRKTSESGRAQRRSRFTDAEIQEMQRLYCEEEQSSGDIAARYKCAGVTVREYLKGLGVRLRAGKEAQALRRKRENGHSETTYKEKENNAPRQQEHSTRTYTPPKRLGKVFEPIPLLRQAEVTPERILQLYKKDDLLIDDIAAVCSLSNVEVYNILREAGGL